MPTTLALNFAFSPPSRRAPLTGHTWAESHTCEREHVLIRSPVPAGEAALGSDAKRLGLTNLTTGLAVRGRGELRRRLRGRRDTLPRAQSEATSQTPLLPPDDEHRMHGVRQRTGGRTEGPGSPGSPPGPPPGAGGHPLGGRRRRRRCSGSRHLNGVAGTLPAALAYLQDGPGAVQATLSGFSASSTAASRVEGQGAQPAGPPPASRRPERMLAARLPATHAQGLRTGLGWAGPLWAQPTRGRLSERAGLPGELSGTQGPPGRRGW